MNGAAFAEWLRRQGHRVAASESSLWYDASPRVYQAFPFHRVIAPSLAELADLLRRERAIALRCSTPLASAPGRVSYHVVRVQRPYELAALERRSRQGVRHGLGRARVERISLERLGEEGFELEVETCVRQGRGVSVSAAAWSRRCRAAADLPGFEAWGALVDGHLAATVLAAQVDDCYTLLTQQCRAAYLGDHVNAALAFTVTREALARPGVAAVFYTLQSLDAPPSVDVFKLRLGFEAIPVRQRVAFHPWLEPLVGPRALGLVHATASRFPGHRVLSKADGMLRFHLDGRAPLETQAWPELLARPDHPAEPQAPARSP